MSSLITKLLGSWRHALLTVGVLLAVAAVTFALVRAFDGDDDPGLRADADRPAVSHSLHHSEGDDRGASQASGSSGSQTASGDGSSYGPDDSSASYDDASASDTGNGDEQVGGDRVASHAPSGGNSEKTTAGSDDTKSDKTGEADKKTTGDEKHKPVTPGPKKRTGSSNSTQPAGGGTNQAAPSSSQAASTAPATVVDTPGLPFAISGGTVASLYPGLWRPITLTISNPNSEQIYVTGLSITAADAPGCPVDPNLELEQPDVDSTSAKRIAVPANGVATIPAGSSPRIRLRNLSVNQDACKDVLFALAFTGTATT